MNSINFISIAHTSELVDEIEKYVKYYNEDRIKKIKRNLSCYEQTTFHKKII
ncbi:IS3 family transposase [Anaerococcus sp. Marseille-P3625]|uniref:IS3 family transposase n=1 Tax=Anaerococcus sp. Marseille-P3625 TaxID=1977277 RepID=UPI00117A125F